MKLIDLINRGRTLYQALQQASNAGLAGAAPVDPYAAHRATNIAPDPILAHLQTAMPKLPDTVKLANDLHDALNVLPRVKGSLHHQAHYAAAVDDLADQIVLLVPDDATFLALCDQLGLDSSSVLHLPMHERLKNVVHNALEHGLHGRLVHVLAVIRQEQLHERAKWLSTLNSDQHATYQHLTGNIQYGGGN